MNFPDLTNCEFGKLWVIGLKETGRHNPTDLWLCACKCGNYSRYIIPGEYLRSSEMWSCGRCDRSANHLRRRLLDQLIVDGVVVKA